MLSGLNTSKRLPRCGSNFSNMRDIAISSARCSRMSSDVTSTSGRYVRRKFAFRANMNAKYLFRIQKLRTPCSESCLILILSDFMGDARVGGNI